MNSVNSKKFPKPFPFLYAIRYPLNAIIYPLSAIVLVLALSGCGRAPEPKSEKPLIGLSLADLKEERWQRDRDMFVAKAKQLGAEVLVQDAGGDPQAQIEQARSLLLRGAKALVIVPKNAAAAAPIVLAAHAKNVKVISYDRLITNAEPDLYLSFDNYRVGEIQASAVLGRAPKGKYLLLGGDPADQNSAMLREGQMKVLRPAVERGDIQIVGDPFCDKWSRSEAMRYTEDALARHPDLAAVVASNDQTAGGAIAALTAKGLAGKVLVSGQDADLEACRNIVKGLQTVTVYKPIRRIASAAAELAVMYARGQPDMAVELQLTTEGGSFGGRYLRLDNGSGKQVPTFFLDPIAVGKENLDATVIADGYHTREQVYGPHE